MLKSILITGCNRGIGLGILKHLVKEKNPPKHIIATCRNLQNAKDLEELADSNDNVKLLELDIKNYNGYESFSKNVEDIVKEDGINVLINNAGVSSKFTRIQYVKYEQMLEAFQVNTIGPIMLTKTLLPLLKRSTRNNSNQPLGEQRAVVVNMTSILGSISKNMEGGFFPYRCSKAALNMATKSLSIDLHKEGILVVGIHPGWVKTDMGGSSAPLDVETSVHGIFKVLNNINETHNGNIWQYDGQQLDW